MSDLEKFSQNYQLLLSYFVNHCPTERQDPQFVAQSQTYLEALQEEDPSDDETRETGDSQGQEEILG